FLGLGPQPFQRAVVQPEPRRIGEKPVSQTEHSRLLPPVCNAIARFRPIERHRTHDCKAAGVFPDRRECHVRRIRVPARRMNDGGIDAAFIHQTDGLLGGKRRYLPVREVARQTASPAVNLSVDDLHRALRYAASAGLLACSTSWIAAMIRLRSGKTWFS